MGSEARGRIRVGMQNECAEITENPEIDVRPVNPADFFLLYRWANDEKTRENSLNHLPISLLEHSKWFVKRLCGRRAATLIVRGRLEGQRSVPMMVCRVDPASGLPDTWIISVNLGPRFRGRGISTALLGRAIAAFTMRIRSIGTLRAIILRQNIPSLKLFTKLGFHVIENEGNLIALEKRVR